MNSQAYVGGELDLFSHALYWKQYWSRQLRPYIQGAVLEVGAGIGSNTVTLWHPAATRWVCLEPDAQLLAALQQRVAESPAKGRCEARVGFVSSLPPQECFDTILYIDVLEHIADDREELRQASAHLSPGGHLAVLSPAHAWLYSPFDKAIGHHRRYCAKTLAALAPPGTRRERIFYLDSAGLLASAANRLLLKQSLPGLKQILFWDRFLVPCSRVLDWGLRYRLGKSVVAVWKKKG